LFLFLALHFIWGRKNIFGVKNKIFLGEKKIILGWFFIWGKRINFGVKKD
jgi:hypothetical protein